MNRRHLLREQALQALYAYQFSQNTVEQVLSDPLILHEAEFRSDPFLARLVKTAAQSQGELDMLIEQSAKNWYLSRIAFIDRIILRMAIAEFLYFPEIPPKVSIDEAIELSKTFSTQESSKFINGILDKVLSELTRAHKINKTGRGLLNSSH